MKLFYTCGPDHADHDHKSMPLAARGAVKRSKSAIARNHTFAVDIHCHMLVPEVDEMVKPVFNPELEPIIKFSTQATRDYNRERMPPTRRKLISVDERLADMDKTGIDIQAISPAATQYLYWADPDLVRQTSRIVNTRIAETVAAHPDRFVGLGTVPMQAPELAVAELEYMSKELGLRGVEISSNVVGEELSNERFRPFWAKAEELGLLVFMHPWGFSEGQRLTDFYFINTLGNPLDTSIAVAHLIFNGVFDAYPKLKLVLAHGGGFLASYPGRMDHAHEVRGDNKIFIKKKPSSYLKKLYFDTVVFNHAQLEFLAAQYGADHLLLGTDYPYDMSEGDPQGFIAGAKLSRQDKESILGLNAAKLLKIKVPAKAARASAAKKIAKKPAKKAAAKTAVKKAPAKKTAVKKSGAIKKVAKRTATKKTASKKR